jgi:cobalt-zinc-cadmium resistance protein CzcA
MQRLAIILPATIGLILLLLFVTFGSLRVSLLVISILPFAHWRVRRSTFRGLSLSRPRSASSPFGIAVLNGIVSPYIAQLQEAEDGKAIVQAVQPPAPGAMTATITIFSLVLPSRAGRD